MRNLLLATALVATTAGWAQPRPSASFDPAGKWSYTTTDDTGAPIAGTLTIAGKPGAFTGTVSNGQGRELPVTEVLTSPTGMVVLADLPDGGLAVIRVFRGADGKLLGSWGPIRAMIPATVEKAK